MKAPPSTDPVGIGKFVYHPDLRVPDMQTRWDCWGPEQFKAQLVEHIKAGQLDACDLYGIEKRQLLCPPGVTAAEYEKYSIDIYRIITRWIPELEKNISLHGDAPGRERMAAHVLEELFLRNGAMRGGNVIEKPIEELMADIRRRRENYPAIIPTKKHTMFTNEGREIWWRWLVQEVTSTAMWYEEFRDETEKRKLLIEDMLRIVKKGVTAAFPGHRQTTVEKIFLRDSRDRLVETTDYRVIARVADEDYLLFTINCYGNMFPAPYTSLIKSAWGSTKEDMTPVGDSITPSITNAITGRTIRQVIMLARLMHWRVPERYNSLLEYRKMPSRLVDTVPGSYSELYFV